VQLQIMGATLIDGTGRRPIEDCSIRVRGNRIEFVGQARVPGEPEDGVTVIDAHGKYVIPGLMNANVHLFAGFVLTSLLRYENRYGDLILEAAQVALRNGLTTVFDTWGPRRFLMSVRDSINRGERPGSRIFCAGNIIGFDGPFSADFLPKASEVVSSGVAHRINSIWVENVGRRLMWMSADTVGEEVTKYARRGIDFVKYAANDHYPGAFLAFSSAAQRAIVEAAHREGLTAQAHALSVEGLRTALEAGCDLITHCNVTGPVPIPDSTLDLFSKLRAGAVIFPWTARALEWITKNCSDMDWRVADANVRNLIKSEAMLLLANDGALYPRELATDPAWANWSIAAPHDNLFSLEHGHFTWFKAMEEKGCDPMRMLQSATRNIAVAYGKERDLGTVEAGKLADMVILNENPLDAADNYRSIHMVIRDGALVDRSALPEVPILTAAPEPAAEEEASYVPFVEGKTLPACPACLKR
jgi:imidazolonepropionase-like amidohydrolase